jgi:hypothetical protein
MYLEVKSYTPDIKNEAPYSTCVIWRLEGGGACYIATGSVTLVFNCKSQKG